ncbi:hypothetical protein [Micromonospora sp. NPDC049799]|uniref:hypothetical protein n=1 Tax=Micromonospora sp. NPDC049799 TaxID=3154741 RepID=UPI0033FB4D72
MTVVGLAALLSVTGCTGSSEGGEAAGTTSAAATGAASSPSDASVVSAKDVCAYLDGRLPTLRDLGSEVGAMANLTVNLYSWYEEQGAVPTGREIDDQTRQECPAIRAEVLELSGMESSERL